MSQPSVDNLIGKVQYEEEGEFPVERGYIWTSCASVENGNPLFWDDAVAAELTSGPIAPPSMLSVPELVEDEQYEARGAFVEASAPEHGAFRQVGYVLAGSGQ